MFLRSLNLICSSPCPNNVSAQVCWKSRHHHFRKYDTGKPFPNILRPHVTLKIWSRSLKFNHFLPIFQQYICASLVEIQPSFQEIWCRQAFYQHFKTLYDLIKGSSSSKSNQHFPSTQRYICVSLVKIHLFMNKIKSILVQQYICAGSVKFNQFLPGTGCRQAIFQPFKTSNILRPCVTLKMGQGHQNLISFCPRPINISVQV